MIDPPARWFLAAAYLLAALFLVNVLTDLAAALAPFQPSDVRWRFGAYGLLTAQIGPIVLALLLAAGAALATEARRTLRGVAVLAFLVAIAMGVGGAVFALDGLELRRLVGPTAIRNFDLAVLKAASLTGLGELLFLTIAIGGWVSSRKKRGRRGPVAPVVGAGTDAPP